MNNEILDEDLISKKENNIQSKILSWTSIIILWFGIGYSFSFGYLTKQDLAAIILLAVVSLICNINFEIGVKITLGLIIAGVFNMVEFLPIKYEISIGTDVFMISIDIILLLVLMIHYLTNKLYFAKYLDYFSVVEQYQDEIKTPNRSRINNFKTRFSNKDIAELEAISKTINSLKKQILLRKNY